MSSVVVTERDSRFMYFCSGTLQAAVFLILRSLKNGRKRSSWVGELFVSGRWRWIKISICDAPLAVHSTRINSLRWTVARIKKSLCCWPSRLGNVTATFMTGNLMCRHTSPPVMTGNPWSFISFPNPSLLTRTIVQKFSSWKIPQASSWIFRLTRRMETWYPIAYVRQDSHRMVPTFSSSVWTVVILLGTSPTVLQVKSALIVSVVTFWVRRASWYMAFRISGGSSRNGKGFTSTWRSIVAFYELLA